MSDEIKRPEGLTDEHLEFLDDLRESGVTNMFGAVPYIVREFEISEDTASSYLVYWMRTFSNRRKEQVLCWNKQVIRKG